jgi:hypothetical protein
VGLLGHLFDGQAALLTEAPEFVAQTAAADRGTGAHGHRHPPGWQIANVDLPTVASQRQTMRSLPARVADRTGIPAPGGGEQ